MGVSADDAAPEGKGHDASEHVLVDARELLGLDFDASLFQDLFDDDFGRGVTDVAPPRRIQPDSRVGALDGPLAATSPTLVVCSTW